MAVLDAMFHNSTTVNLIFAGNKFCGRAICMYRRVIHVEILTSSARSVNKIVSYLRVGITALHVKTWPHVAEELENSTVFVQMYLYSGTAPIASMIA